MLDADIITASHKGFFDEKKKKYHVNMSGNVRTLHITDYKSCPHSKNAFKFIPFESMEEIQEYERVNCNATPFKRCGNCFK